MGSRPHLRRTPRLAAAVLSLVVIAACSDARADLPQSTPASPADPSIASSAPPDPSIDMATSLADTGAPGIATSLIDDCVAFVQYGAFIGNSLLTEMWNAAGQDVATMRTSCEVTGRADITALEAMSAQWVAIERYQSAATATPITEPGDAGATETSANSDGPATTAPAAIAVAPPGFECDPNYTGCVPIASDVDCAGQGDGPAFQTEPVGIVARDIYELDPDGNSVGCG